jgi:hypothetical protein
MKILLPLLCALFLFTTKANAQSCVISFSDSFGLTLLDPSMAYGFMAPGGGVVWYYNECGAGSDNWLYLDEDPDGGFPGGVEYGHFHIPFADPTVNCFTTTATYPLGVMGKQSSPGDPCVAINPLNKPRTLLPHRPDGILRIRYLAHSGDPLRYLLPNAVRVIGPTPVSVLFQAANGSWWVWSNLTAGSWNLNGALPARRVFVLSNVGNVGSPWHIADLGITLGDYYTPPPPLTNICLLCYQNQYRTVRDFLSTVTLRQPTDLQTTTSAEVPGSDASLVAAIQNEKSARSISEQEALRLLQRPRHDRGDHHKGDHDEDMSEILAKIPEASGTERQVLIAEYLLAASKLPRFQQAAAHRRLVALFESKR